MPVRHLGLAETPAEENVLAVAAGGEVDQPGVEILHLDAELLDRANGLGDGRRLHLDLTGQLGQLARRHAAAVPRDRGQRGRAPGLGGRERAAVLDHLFDERTHLGERPIRLLGREGAGHQASIIVGLVSAGQRLKAPRAGAGKLELGHERERLGRVSLGDLDAVTIDAYGTLVELERPVERLRAALELRGSRAERGGGRGRLPGRGRVLLRAQGGGRGATTRSRTCGPGARRVRRRARSRWPRLHGRLRRCARVRAACRASGRRSSVSALAAWHSRSSRTGTSACTSTCARLGLTPIFDVIVTVRGGRGREARSDALPSGARPSARGARASAPRR